MDREVALENEIAAILHLLHRAETIQVHRRALAFGELGSENQRPVIQPLPDEAGAETIGRRLQGLRIGDGEESVVVLAEGDTGAVQFLFDEGVPVEPIGSVKREERSHPHNDGAEDLVTDVKIIMGEAAAVLVRYAFRPSGLRLCSRGVRNSIVFKGR